MSRICDEGAMETSRGRNRVGTRDWSLVLQLPRIYESVFCLKDGQ